ncbi:unnamed protein product [Bursaphelenchus okinawaensis]|uniref:Uncharacterized protein n=1 Tax=Bursaphelenchus okinawaensis TaxID=465554 RepID=A0A811LLT4_9BILA|nr:unnamed protein product [Bursaphelenchus okinawaensis]CAG9124793.1 unnamed protein product [Bursaphelenchus okinawaensis]
MLRSSQIPRRLFSISSINRILSQEFRLDNEWEQRISHLKEFNMGGSYEWITSVQKKMAGDGKASAIDVDAAVCIAKEQDQVEDVVDLVYKLRHTSNAGFTLPSTSYGLVRLLLKYDQVAEVFKVLNDSINYGVFPDEHAYAVLIDYFLKKNNVPGAAKVASMVMQQEMFDSELLNLVGVYSLIKFVELEKDQRVFDDVVNGKEAVEESNDMDFEDELTFRFPYLRPAYNDNHFDIESAKDLVAKSLDWYSWYKPEWKPSLQLLSAVVKEDVSKVKLILEKKEKLEGSAVGLAKKLIDEYSGVNSEEVKEGEEAKEGGEEKKEGEEATAEEAGPWDEVKKLLPKSETTEAFSTVVHNHIKANQANLEQTLIRQKKDSFTNWANRRRELIHAQAEHLELQLQLKEIANERQLAKEEIKLLRFFDNRVEWEDKAKEMDELYHEFQLDVEDESQTEEVYGRTIFDKVRDERKMAVHQKKW